VPRTCQTCNHAEVAAIDREIAAGKSLRDLSALFRVSEDSLARHRDAHISPVVVRAQEAEDITRGLDVVKQLKAINGVTMQILHEARQQKNPEVALKAVDRIQRQLELQAKLLGDLDERPVVNILVSSEWLAVRATIIQALDVHPEAKQAVIGALSAKGGMS